MQTVEIKFLVDQNSGRLIEMTSASARATSGTGGTSWQVTFSHTPKDRPGNETETFVKDHPCLEDAIYAILTRERLTAFFIEIPKAE